MWGGSANGLSVPPCNASTIDILAQGGRILLRGMRWLAGGFSVTQKNDKLFWAAWKTSPPRGG